MINTIIRVPAMAVQPMIAPNKTANTITVRATTAVVAIIEKMIEANDKPRAEIVIDVQILEVNRERAKQFGLDLRNYSIARVFSPEADPRGTTGDRRRGDDHAERRTAVQPEHDLARHQHRRLLPGGAVGGRAVPRERHATRKLHRQAAAARRRRAEDHAEPRRRNPGAVDRLHAAGARRREHEPADVVQLPDGRRQRRDDAARDRSRATSSSSSRSRTARSATTSTSPGQNLPSFGSRKVDDAAAPARRRVEPARRPAARRRAASAAGLSRACCGCRSSSSCSRRTTTTIGQTDIVMLLTPRIVRTHELTAGDLSPIFIGTQQNLGLGGPPPVIAPPPEPRTGAARRRLPRHAAGAAPPGRAPIVRRQLRRCRRRPAVPAAPPPRSPPMPRTPPRSQAAPRAAGRGARDRRRLRPRRVATRAARRSSSRRRARVPRRRRTVHGADLGDQRVAAVGLSLTLTFNPAVVRVRAVQEGSFMRAGGVQADLHAAGRRGRRPRRHRDRPPRRRDRRRRHRTARRAGVRRRRRRRGELAVTGTATAPGGAAASLQFTPVPAVTVR